MALFGSKNLTFRYQNQPIYVVYGNTGQHIQSENQTQKRSNHFDKTVPLLLKQMVCIKVKAVPLQAWNGPEGSRKSKFPDFMTTVQDGGKVVSLTHRSPLLPGKTPGTHFC